MKVTRLRPARKRKLEAERKLDIVEQSLSDLLPPGATFAVLPNGSITISAPGRRGHEDEVLADIAKRLNLPLDAFTIDEKP